MATRATLDTAEMKRRLAACAATETSFKDLGKCLPDGNFNYDTVPTDGFNLAVATDANVAVLREAIAANPALGAMYQNFFDQKVDGTSFTPEQIAKTGHSIIPGYRIDKASGGANLDNPDVINASEINEWNTEGGEVDAAGVRNTVRGMNGLLYALRWIANPMESTAEAEGKEKAATGAAAAANAVAEAQRKKDKDVADAAATAAAAESKKFKVRVVFGAIGAAIVVLGLGIWAFVRGKKKDAKVEETGRAGGRKAKTTKPAPKEGAKAAALQITRPGGKTKKFASRAEAANWLAEQASAGMGLTIRKKWAEQLGLPAPKK